MDIVEEGYNTIVETVSVSEDDYEEGCQLYSNYNPWEPWGVDQYDHPGFQYRYFEMLFTERADFVKETLHEIDQFPQFNDLLCQWSDAQEPIKICSLGCGPGAELVGAQAYFNDIGFTFSGGYPMNMMQSTDCLGIDANNWSRYFVNTDIRFEQADIDQDFMQHYCEESDIFILSYFDSATEGFSTWYSDDRFHTNWPFLFDLCHGLVIVIDKPGGHTKSNMYSNQFQQLPHFYSDGANAAARYVKFVD